MFLFSVVPNNNALSLSIVHNACSVFPSLVMHVCTATKIFLYHIGSSATSNSIDFNKVYQLTFNDFYNIIIEILSIRDVEDVTDEMIETYINDPLHIKDGIDPLDPVPTVLFDYEEIRDQIGLVEDDDELDNITEVLNEFSRILPADTRMYDVYNYILTLLNNYV